MRPREFDAFLEQQHAKACPTAQEIADDKRVCIFGPGVSDFVAEYKRNVERLAETMNAARARGKLVCGVEPLDDLRLQRGQRGVSP